MTDKEKIKQILLDYAKNRHIAFNSVTFELLANELVKQGLTFVPTKCQNCTYLTEQGFCYVDIGGVGYKKTHEDGYCDKGIRKEEEM